MREMKEMRDKGKYTLLVGMTDNGVGMFAEGEHVESYLRGLWFLEKGSVAQ